MLLTSTAKKKTLFADTRVSSRGIAGFSEQRTAFTRAQSAILQSRNFNLRVEHAKSSLFTKLISQKRVRWPYFFNAKTCSTARAECMCGIVKKTAEWKFSNLELSVFLNLRKIYSAEFFLIFPVSSFECNKKIFIKKIWGHRLSF